MAKAAKRRMGRGRVRSTAMLKSRARRRARTAAVSGATSSGELLIREMLDSANGGDRQLLMQDLIYNVSGELKRLAYGSGFELGKEVYASSDGTIRGLERTLENAGFGKVLYSPLGSRSVITAYRVKPKGAGLGAYIHDFEAGLIAGYLSAHSKRTIYVREEECTYNGSDCCRFVASAAYERTRAEGKVASVEKMTGVIRENVGFSGSQGTGGPYYLLFARPILREPVLTEASKLMYLTGKRLAETASVGDFEDKVAKMAKYLGIESASVKKGRGKVAEIRLTYGYNSSMGNFVDLTTSMIAGFAKGVLNKNVYVQRRLTRGRKYSVSMRLLPRKADDKKA